MAYEMTKTTKIYSKSDGRMLHHSHHQQREKEEKKEEAEIVTSPYVHVYAATAEILGLEMTLRKRERIQMKTFPRVYNVKLYTAASTTITYIRGTI